MQCSVFSGSGSDENFMLDTKSIGENVKQHCYCCDISADTVINRAEPVVKTSCNLRVLSEENKENYFTLPHLPSNKIYSQSPMSSGHFFMSPQSLDDNKKHNSCATGPNPVSLCKECNGSRTSDMSFPTAFKSLTTASALTEERLHSFPSAHGVNVPLPYKEEILSEENMLSLDQRKEPMGSESSNPVPVSTSSSLSLFPPHTKPYTEMQTKDNSYSKLYTDRGNVSSVRPPLIGQSSDCSSSSKNQVCNYVDFSPYEDYRDDLSYKVEKILGQRIVLSGEDMHNSPPPPSSSKMSLSFCQEEKFHGSGSTSSTAAAPITTVTLTSSSNFPIEGRKSEENIISKFDSLSLHSSKNTVLPGTSVECDQVCSNQSSVPVSDCSARPHYIQSDLAVNIEGLASDSSMFSDFRSRMPLNAEKCIVDKENFVTHSTSPLWCEFTPHSDSKSKVQGENFKYNFVSKSGNLKETATECDVTSKSKSKFPSLFHEDKKPKQTYKSSLAKCSCLQNDCKCENTFKESHRIDNEREPQCLGVLTDEAHSIHTHVLHGAVVSPASASSLASSKHLEWDSGADIGYTASAAHKEDDSCSLLNKTTCPNCPKHQLTQVKHMASRKKETETGKNEFKNYKYVANSSKDSAVELKSALSSYLYNSDMSYGLSSVTGVTTQKNADHEIQTDVLGFTKDIGLQVHVSAVPSDNRSVVERTSREVDTSNRHADGLSSSDMQSQKYLFLPLNCVENNPAKSEEQDFSLQPSANTNQYLRLRPINPTDRFFLHPTGCSNAEAAIQTCGERDHCFNSESSEVSKTEICTENVNNGFEHNEPFNHFPNIPTDFSVAPALPSVVVLDPSPSGNPVVIGHDGVAVPSGKLIFMENHDFEQLMTCNLGSNAYIRLYPIGGSEEPQDIKDAATQTNMSYLAEQYPADPNSHSAVYGKYSMAGDGTHFEVKVAKSLGKLKSVPELGAGQNDFVDVHPRLVSNYNECYNSEAGVIATTLKKDVESTFSAPKGNHNEGTVNVCYQRHNCQGCVRYQHVHSPLDVVADQAPAAAILNSGALGLPSTSVSNNSLGNFPQDTGIEHHESETSISGMVGTSVNARNIENGTKTTAADSLHRNPRTVPQKSVEKVVQRTSTSPLVSSPPGSRSNICCADALSNRSSCLCSFHHEKKENSHFHKNDCVAPATGMLCMKESTKSSEKDGLKLSVKCPSESAGCYSAVNCGAVSSGTKPKTAIHSSRLQSKKVLGAGKAYSPRRARILASQRKMLLRKCSEASSDIQSVNEIIARYRRTAERQMQREVDRMRILKGIISGFRSLIQHRSVYENDSPRAGLSKQQDLSVSSSGSTADSRLSSSSRECFPENSAVKTSAGAVEMPRKTEATVSLSNEPKNTATSKAAANRCQPLSLSDCRCAVFSASNVCSDCKNSSEQTAATHMTLQRCNSYRYTEESYTVSHMPLNRSASATKGVNITCSKLEHVHHEMKSNAVLQLSTSEGQQSGCCSSWVIPIYTELRTSSTKSLSLQDAFSKKCGHVARNMSLRQHLISQLGQKTHPGKLYLHSTGGTVVRGGASGEVGPHILRSSVGQTSHLSAVKGASDILTINTSAAPNAMPQNTEERRKLCIQLLQRLTSCRRRNILSIKAKEKLIKKKLEAYASNRLRSKMFSKRLREGVLQGKLFWARWDHVLPST